MNAPMLDDAAVRQRVARVEQLLGRLEELPASEARETGMDAVAAVLELYGEALRRLREASVSGDGGVARTMAEDELVAHLLLVHGLQPEDVEERLLRSLQPAGGNGRPATEQGFIPVTSVGIRRRGEAGTGA